MTKAEIIKIGNSRGLGIPKALKQCGMKPRENWGKAFKLMAKNNDDQLIEQDISEHSWDEKEWQW